MGVSLLSLSYSLSYLTYLLLTYLLITYLLILYRRSKTLRTKRYKTIVTALQNRYGALRSVTKRYQRYKALQAVRSEGSWTY